MAEFLQWVELEGTFKGHMFVRNSSGEPRDADSSPTYRIYGPDGLMQGGTGTTSGFLDEKAITSVTSGSPSTTITSANHGLNTGTVVKLAGISGLTGTINSYYAITVVDANTFTVVAATTGGTVSQGAATWHVAGLYKYSHSITGASGYERGKRYTVIGSVVITAVSVAGDDGFIVV